MTQGVVEIVVDGGPGLGFGHLSRTETLARALRAQGLGVTWSPQSALARQFCETRPSDKGEICLVLVDLPYANDDAVRAAKAKGLPTVGLDYLGEAGPDCLIRLNPPLTSIPAGRTLYGLEYAIIREDVRVLHAMPGDYVFIQIGGSDYGDLGPQAAQILHDQGERVILVRGPIAREYDFSDAPYEVVHTPDNLPELMAGCHFAVTNGGTTLMELMSLGKAVHAIAQTDEERRFICPMLKEGIILGQGLEALSLPDLYLIDRVAHRARDVIDGLGAERIAKLAHDLMRVSGPVA